MRRQVVYVFESEVEEKAWLEHVSGVQPSPMLGALHRDVRSRIRSEVVRELFDAMVTAGQRGIDLAREAQVRGVTTRMAGALVSTMRRLEHVMGLPAGGLMTAIPAPPDASGVFSATWYRFEAQASATLLGSHNDLNVAVAPPTSKVLYVLPPKREERVGERGREEERGGERVVDLWDEVCWGW